jgi:hypothetical protein
MPDSTTVFADVPAWPKQGSGETLSSGRDARLDNAPPLDERVVQEFIEDVDREGITARIAELLASAGRAPKCDSQTVAGQIGDLCKLAGDVTKRLDAAREKHNRPILTAQRNLKAKADGLIAPLTSAIAKLRDDLNRFTREETARRDAERRAQEEEARRLREEQERIAAERAEAGQPAAPQVEIMVPRAEPEPIARGDYGARVGTQKAWFHEIESVRQLPDRILKNPRVIEALDKVIAAEIRAGAREIKGTKIWSEDRAVVR